MPVTLAKPNGQAKSTAQQPTAKQQFPTRIAQRARKSCRYCSQEIPIGDRISKVPNRTGKSFTWVHEQCAIDGPMIVIGGVVRDGVQVAAAAGPAVDGDARSLIRNLQSELSGLRDQLAKLEAKTPRPVVIKIAEEKPIELKGIVHPAMEELTKHVSRNQPVMMIGPTGSGKTKLAQQCAEEILKMRFASISCTVGMSESHIIGRSLPTGKQGQFTFCGTPFLECYEKGGVFLFDEMDAADPNVLLVINSAISNDFLSVPARHTKPKAVRHADFRCIAAANTLGRGANRLYGARNALDFATLKRFPVGKMFVTYNRELETQLWHVECGTDHDDRLHKFWRYREGIEANCIEQAVTTRDLIAFANYTACGESMEYIEKQLFLDFTEDEEAKIRNF